VEEMKKDERLAKQCCKEIELEIGKKDWRIIVMEIQ